MSLPPPIRSIVLERPAAIHMGIGVTTQIGAFAAARGIERTLVIAARSCRARVGELGLASEIALFDGIDGEPDTHMLDAARAVADAFVPDMVVGFGGGSAMDLAKLVAVLTGASVALQDIVGVGLAPARRVALAQVPATAGTGSEAGPRALVSDAATGAKLAVDSPHMMADIAAIDPRMSATVPPAITAETGLDALTHCVEAFTNVKAHPAIDLYAREGIRLIGRYLRRAVEQGDDLEARGGVALAALYGGYCLGPVNTAAGHAVAYPLSTRHGLSHGLANALIFPHMLAFNASARPGRTREVLDLLGLGRVGGNAIYDAASGFCRSLGLETGLAAHGIGERDIEAMAGEAIGIRRLLDNNPREVSREDIARLYRAAL